MGLGDGPLVHHPRSWIVPPYIYIYNDSFVVCPGKHCSSYFYLWDTAQCTVDKKRLRKNLSSRHHTVSRRQIHKNMVFIDKNKMNSVYQTKPRTRSVPQRNVTSIYTNIYIYMCVCVCVCVCVCEIHQWLLMVNSFNMQACLLVFSPPANNSLKDHVFPVLSWSRKQIQRVYPDLGPSRWGNSPTSSGVN
jgi:hypothetical protein